MGRLEGIAPPDPFRRYQNELETELVAATGDDPLHFYTIMRYHMGWVDPQGSPHKAPQGKHLRPTLCLLACEVVGGDWHQALPAAAALELVHNFTLIHDDVQDKSHKRRHRPTVWSLWGTAQAINAGDGMWALAQMALLRLRDKKVAHDKVILASRLLSGACLTLCEGQYLDMDFESRPEIDVEDYLRMIDAKTAQLFSCAVVLGALVGGAKEEQIEQLSAFGRQLGLAFQVQDDLLGIWEKQKTTGKSACTDIREKKKTLPVIYALKNATGNEKIRLSGLYQSRKRRLTSAEVAEVVGILDNVGARRHTEEFKQRYQKRALEQLSKMDIPQPRAAELREMADFILSQG